MLKTAILNSLIIFCTFSSFADTVQPSHVPEGKAQIILYRYKTIVGGFLPAYFFDVTENYRHLQFEGKDVDQNVDRLGKTEPISYSAAKTTAKKIGDRFRNGHFEVMTVEPGTYYFITTNVDLTSDRGQPLGNVSKIYYPVVSIPVESGNRYFVKSEFLYGKGSSVAIPTQAEAYGDLKWEHSGMAGAQKRKIKDIATICSEVNLQQDSIAQLADDYKRYSEMEQKGRRQVTGGNLCIFLGMPVGIAIPVIIGAIATSASSTTESIEHDYYTEYKTEINMVPLYVGMAVGTGVGATFFASGLNLKKKGKVNRSNGSFKRKEIQMKLEASCNNVSLSINF